MSATVELELRLKGCQADIAELEAQLKGCKADFRAREEALKCRTEELASCHLECERLKLAALNIRWGKGV